MKYIKEALRDTEGKIKISETCLMGQIENIGEERYLK